MRSPKKYFRASIRVLGTNIRLGIGRVFHRGHLRFSPKTCLAFTDRIEISRDGVIDFGVGLRTRGLCLFNVQEKGELIFGENVFLNSGCLFNCHCRISIGNGCEFGPNVLLYDHDHDFIEGGA